MLSDRLFDVRWKLLYHIQLAQMAFDSFERPNNHKWSIKEKKLAMDRAVLEYDDAVNQK